MCAMCLAGLVAGRMAGVPGKVLLPVALGLVVVLFMVWIKPPAGSWTTSALAHAIGGTLAGWALVEALRHRGHDGLTVALLALAAVVALTCVWEPGEYAGDRLLDTALVPSKRDSAEDVLFGTAGGLVGITLAGVAALARRGQRRPVVTAVLARGQAAGPGRVPEEQTGHDARGSRRAEPWLEPGPGSA